MAKKTTIMQAPELAATDGSSETGETADARKTEVRGVDAIIRKGVANCYQGFANIGGQLTLTDRSLIFKPHVLNLRRKELDIPVKEIVAVERRNTLVIIPNCFGVQLKDGTSFRFSVYGRDDWIKDVVETRSRVSKPTKR